jgi:hypothetical protein
MRTLNTLVSSDRPNLRKVTLFHISYRMGIVIRPGYGPDSLFCEFVRL